MKRKIVLFLGSIVVLLAGISLGLQMQNSPTQQSVAQLVASNDSDISLFTPSRTVPTASLSVDGGENTPPPAVDVSKEEERVSVDQRKELVSNPPVKPVEEKKPASNPVKPVVEKKPAPSSSKSVESQKPERMTIKSQLGMTFNIDLPNRGWVLITDVKGSLQVVERTNLANNATRYTFKTVQVGTYKLEFSRQTAQGYEKRDVDIIIEAPKNSTTVAKPVSYTPAPNKAVESKPVENKVVVNENKPPVEPVITEKSPQPQGLSTPNVETSEDNALSLEQIIIDAKASGELLSYTQMLRNEKNNLNRDMLKKAFDLLWQEHSSYLLATELGEAFVTRFRTDTYSAEILYRLGRIYEAQGQERDLRRSYGYYSRVFEEYPITPYSRLSKERMDYLDRFFFQIQ